MVFGLLGINRADLLGAAGNTFLFEIIDIVIMSLFLGFIFKDMFQARGHYEPLKKHSHFKTALIAVAPAVIFHELGHKFISEFLGVSATFYAAYGFLILGFLLKLAGLGVFLIPGYVSHAANIAPFKSALIGFAGPGINLLFWLVAGYFVKNASKYKLKMKYITLLVYTAQINKFLFFFNMIPIPPFDGFHVLSGLLGMF